MRMPAEAIAAKNQSLCRELASLAGIIFRFIRQQCRLQ